MEYAEVQQHTQAFYEASASAIESFFHTMTVPITRWFSGAQGFSRDNFQGDLMLVVTELAEACEANRTGAQSDKIPGFLGEEEELADALVRIFHMAGKYNLRLGPAFVAKMQMNLTRPYKHGKNS